MYHFLQGGSNVDHMTFNRALVEKYDRPGPRYTSYPTAPQFHEAFAEDDYFQACRAAKTGMQERGGDPAAQVEPYLETLQQGGPVGTGLFDKPWPELTPGQQSAVIVAVEAAADDLCG